MPHSKLKVAANGMLDAYKALLDSRGYVADAAQMTAATALQTLYTNLLYFKVNRASTFKRLLSPPKPPKGVYFWGGVGRGKSFLMDCFYESVPYRRKKRIHFHAFMQQIHRDLEKFKGETDPMLKLAEEIGREVRLLCFDEFHVSDIADAMILGRLMEGLFSKGVIIVMTSNYPPDMLYPNGLHRESFLPTIALLNKHLGVFEVEAGNDYLEISRSYHTVLLSHIPKMTMHQASEARRFTWLVDVFYDHKVKLIATADCAAEALYTEGTQAGEFARTVSRLRKLF